MPDCTKYKHLMMGLIDNELTPEESADVNRHLIRCEICRKEFDALSRSHAKLDAFSFSGPEDGELDRIWKSPFSRFTRNTGLFMVIAAWVTLLLYSLYEFINSGTEPFIPKIAVLGIILGFIILLYSALRDRIRTFKTDPYKEVER